MYHNVSNMQSSRERYTIIYVKYAVSGFSGDE